jgi:hypothetical protein
VFLKKSPRQKEVKMRKFMALLIAAGLVFVFSSAALAGAFGECSYGSHNQAATDKADAAKPVATKAPEKADSTKVASVPTVQPAQPAAEVKK